MTSLDQPPRGGRFGAADPGARPSPPSLEGLLTAGPPRRRLTLRRVLAVIGVLVVAAGAYVAGHYTWTTPPPPVSQLVITSTALPAGARLTGADLQVVTVRPGDGVPPGTLSPAAAAGLIGLVTRSALPGGTFLQRSLLTPSGAIPRPTEALVGLALKPGQLPAAGLTVGERVLVVLLPVTAQGTALRPVPLVTTTTWYLSGPDSSGTTDATVVVPARLAPLLAGYSARSQVALVATNSTRSAAAASRPSPPPHSASSKPAKTSPKPGKSRKAKSGNK